VPVLNESLQQISCVVHNVGWEYLLYSIAINSTAFLGICGENRCDFIVINRCLCQTSHPHTMVQNFSDREAFREHGVYMYKEHLNVYTRGTAVTGHFGHRTSGHKTLRTRTIGLHFGTNFVVPKCLVAELSCVRSVRLPAQRPDETTPIDFGLLFVKR